MERDSSALVMTREDNDDESVAETALSAADTTRIVAKNRANLHLLLSSQGSGVTFLYSSKITNED